MSENRIDAELIVVADEAGSILAAADLSYRDRDAPDAPSHVDVIALEGQVVRRVKMPEELTRADIAANVLREYRLQVEGPEAQLVRHSTSSD